MHTKRSFLMLLTILAFSILLIAPHSTFSKAPDADLKDIASLVSIPNLTIMDTTPVKYHVIIERVTATNNFDGPFDFDRADFFARVRIGTTIFESPIISNNDDILPGWEFSLPVNVDLVTDDTVSIAIEIWDSDDWGNIQQADLTSDGNRALLLTVHTNNCLVPGTPGGITGTVSGSCGQTIFSSGTASNNTADIRFRIEAEWPPSSSDLLVRCLHFPIWPQAGETVNVRAEALNGDLDPITVDEIEIQVDGGSTSTCTDVTECNASLAAPSSGNTISYSCSVQDSSDPPVRVEHSTQVGYSLSGNAVPILLTGPRSSRIDIVFVPDQDSYTSELDSAFIGGTFAVIDGAYYGRNSLSTGTDSHYGERLVLANQDKFNFWIATDMGIANGFPSSGPCIQAPSNWQNEYKFADAGVILHTDNLRDCARRNQRIFSSEPTSDRTVLHETGHAPFGLADEYCCDSNYFEPDPMPNIYDSLEDCNADIINLQVFDVIIQDLPRTTCRQIADGTGDTVPFFTSEPASNDLMLDGGELNGADIRRIEWGLTQCDSGGCGTSGSGLSQLKELETGNGGLEKSIVVEVSFLGREDVFQLPSSPQVLYGASRTSFGAPPMLRIDLFDTTGQLIGQFNEWHPLIESGTIEFEDLSVEHDEDVWLNQSTGRFIFPFKPDLATMQITDVELGITLITIDLLPSMETFCDQNPSEPDCELVGSSLHKTFLPIVLKESQP